MSAQLPREQSQQLMQPQMQTSQQFHRSRSHLRFRKSVPNFRARSTSPARSQLQDSNRITVADIIGEYIQGNSELKILSEFDRYRTYIFSKARRLREFTERISAQQLAALTTQDRHFNIALSHIIMKMVQGGQLDVNFDNLKRQTFDKIEVWLIDWVKRKLEYKAANRRLAQKQKIVNDKFSDFYKHLNNKKYESFP